MDGFHLFWRPRPFSSQGWVYIVLSNQVGLMQIDFNIVKICYWCYVVISCAFCCLEKAISTVCTSSGFAKLVLTSISDFWLDSSLPDFASSVKHSVLNCRYLLYFILVCVNDDVCSYWIPYLCTPAANIVNDKDHRVTWRMRGWNSLMMD